MPIGDLGNAPGNTPLAFPLCAAEHSPSCQSVISASTLGKLAPFPASSSSIAARVAAWPVSSAVAAISASNCALRASYWRSEEHTSELQSLMRISYAVFCLKKKNKHIITLSTPYKPKTKVITNILTQIHHKIYPIHHTTNI